MMKNTVLWCLALSLLAGSGYAKDEATPNDAFKGKITISGAWALYPMVVKWAEEYQKLHPDVAIDVSGGGAGKGMSDALAQAVDLGMVSRAVNEAETRKGAWWVSVVKDAVVPTISSDNPLKARLAERGLTRDELARIWITGDATNWNDIVKDMGKICPIRVYTRSDSCGAAETWAKYLGKPSQDSLRGVGASSDPGLAEAVRKDSMGIGYNNIGFAYDPDSKTPVAGLTILPIDINANGKIDADENFYGNMKSITEAIANGKYPSPPARDLNLVSQGVPKRAVVVEFLRWTMTDGQRFVSAAGFIALPDAKLREGSAKLDAK